jgi:mannose-6-phosphate isomerase-like protein (cupin superfamily)
MDAWELTDLIARRAAGGRPYLEFLTVPDLSAGLYVLAAGEEDRQSPHGEDEMYYAVSGRGRIRVADDDRVVEPGTVVFVAAAVPHRFHDITEDLTLLVMFGPAEGSRGRDPG